MRPAHSVSLRFQALASLGWRKRKEEHVVGRPEEIQAALTLEEHTKRILAAALNDEQFMKDIREAQQLEAAGDKGELWSEVKTRLGLV